jgi:hypothetical protein
MIYSLVEKRRSSSIAIRFDDTLFRLSPSSCLSHHCRPRSPQKLLDTGQADQEARLTNHRAIRNDSIRQHGEKERSKTKHLSTRVATLTIRDIQFL